LPTNILTICNIKHLNTISISQAIQQSIIIFLYFFSKIFWQLTTINGPIFDKVSRILTIILINKPAKKNFDPNLTKRLVSWEKMMIKIDVIESIISNAQNDSFINVIILYECWWCYSYTSILLIYDNKYSLRFSMMKMMQYIIAY